MRASFARTVLSPLRGLKRQRADSFPRVSGDARVLRDSGMTAGVVVLAVARGGVGRAADYGHELRVPRLPFHLVKGPLDDSRCCCST